MMILFNKYKTIDEYNQCLLKYNKLNDKIIRGYKHSHDEKSLLLLPNINLSKITSSIYYYNYDEFIIQHIYSWKETYHKNTRTENKITIINIIPKSLNIFIQFIKFNIFGYIIIMNGKIQFLIHNKLTLLKHMFNYYTDCDTYDNMIYKFTHTKYVFHEIYNFCDDKLLLYKLPIFNKEIFNICDMKKTYIDYMIHHKFHKAPYTIYNIFNRYNNYLCKIFYMDEKYIFDIIKKYDIFDIYKCNIYFNLIEYNFNKQHIYQNVLFPLILSIEPKVFCRYMIMKYKQYSSYDRVICQILIYIKCNKILNNHTNKVTQINQYFKSEYNKIEEYTENINKLISSYIKIMKQLYSIQIYNNPIISNNIIDKINIEHKKNKSVSKSELCIQIYDDMEKIISLILLNKSLINTNKTYFNNIRKINEMFINYKKKFNKVKKILYKILYIIF